MYIRLAKISLGSPTRDFSKVIFKQRALIHFQFLAGASPRCCLLSMGSREKCDHCGRLRHVWVLLHPRSLHWPVSRNVSKRLRWGEESGRNWTSVGIGACSMAGLFWKSRPSAGLDANISKIALVERWTWRHFPWESLLPPAKLHWDCWPQKAQLNEQARFFSVNENHQFLKITDV